MTNFEIYRKEVYELVTETEHRLHINIHANLEAYVVNLVAQYFDKPNLDYTEPIAITYLTMKQNQTANQVKLQDRKSTRLNSSHSQQSRMPSSA